MPSHTRFRLILTCVVLLLAAAPLYAEPATTGRWERLPLPTKGHMVIRGVGISPDGMIWF